MNVEMQQRLTYVLGAICAVFALALVLIWLGLGRSFGWSAPNPALAPQLPDPSRLEDLSFQMPPYEHYIEITQRPLFSDDRKPIPPDAESGQGDQPAAPEVPLRVALTGVVLTPEVKVALLRDLNNNETVTLHEGMPLPGNQAGWTLVEIQPRKVIVADAAAKTTEIELTPPGRNPAPPGELGDPVPPPPQQAQQDPQQQQQAADELRARIEARRQELREQAERLRQQGQGGEAPPTESQE